MTIQFKNFSGASLSTEELNILRAFLAEGLKKSPNTSYLKNDQLRTYQWHLVFDSSSGKLIGTVATREDQDGIYITHVVKDSYRSGNLPNFFKSALGHIEKYYKKKGVIKYKLKVDPAKIGLVRTYRNAGFINNFNRQTAARLTPLVKTKIKSPKTKTLTLNTSTKMNEDTRAKLLFKTYDRWIKARQLWNAANDNSWKGLLQGNLAVSMFVMLNQYSVDNTSVRKTIGMNYHLPNNIRFPHPQPGVMRKFTTHDHFIEGIYTLSYNSLKQLLFYDFDIIYNVWEQQFQALNPTPLDIINNITRYFNYGLTINGIPCMSSYQGNNGLFQWLAMYGNDRTQVHPGNCVILMLFRLAIYERYTKGKQRLITFLPQGKQVINEGFHGLEICHLGFGMMGMTPQNAYNSGIFTVDPRSRYPYLHNYNFGNKQLDYKYQYSVMYNQLTTNMIFRAKKRAQRSNNSGKVLQQLEKMSVLLQHPMNVKSRSLHSHRV